MDEYYNFYVVSILAKKFSVRLKVISILEGGILVKGLKGVFLCFGKGGILLF